jgi:hypothetical protein
LSQKTGELRSQWRLQIRLNSFPWDFSDRHLIAIKASGAFEKAIYLEEIDLSAVFDVATKAAYTPPA